jgi:hypothetical protein
MEKGIQEPQSKFTHTVFRVPQSMSPRRNWGSPTPIPASECTTGEKATLPTLWWGPLWKTYSLHVKMDNSEMACHPSLSSLLTCVSALMTQQNNRLLSITSTNAQILFYLFSPFSQPTGVS